MHNRKHVKAEIKLTFLFVDLRIKRLFLKWGVKKDIQFTSISY